MTALQLTEYGQKVAQGIVEMRYGWFDNGWVEGSGIWSEELAYWTPKVIGVEQAQVGGIIGGMIDAGFFTRSEMEPNEFWLELTEAGAAYCEALDEERPVG